MELNNFRSPGEVYNQVYQDLKYLWVSGNTFVVVKEQPLDFKKMLSAILFSITGKSVVWVSVYFKLEKYEIIDIHSNIVILKLFIS